MIGVVLLTQGNLAHSFCELLQKISHLSGHVRYMGLSVDVNLELAKEALLEVVDDADQGSGVLILTEVFCGVSTNLALSILDMRSVEVVAGMNLPMILRLLQLPEDILLEEAAGIIKETGRKHITVASKYLDVA